ncbi:cell adhesion molecule 3-like [Polyodon spathula]|uniref:cell adhesion molecule 3-like n=1 Tax=Polyodon spathula TaxID=7913 RepID=UPI001B7F2C1F|nr:cell adhesion molecule 3-like [Polyodon spathula]
MTSSTHHTLLLFCSATILVAHGNLVMYGDPFQPVTKDEIVSSGGTVTLTCTVEDNDNSSLQWSNTAQQTLYFGEKRVDAHGNRIQLVKSTPTELSISISDVELLDEGEYTCSIFTMPVRTARATVTVLGVPQKPRISGNTDPVEDGGKLKLTCTTSGSKPPARLRWWKEGQELEGFPSTVESDPDGRSFKVTSDIVLTVTKSDNHATIRCSVDHESMPSAEKFTEEKIEVLFKPSVVIKPMNNLPREGDRFHLDCVGLGNPDPASFSWRKESGELPVLSKKEDNRLVFEALNKSDDGTLAGSSPVVMTTGLRELFRLLLSKICMGDAPIFVSVASTFSTRTDWEGFHFPEGVSQLCLHSPLFLSLSSLSLLLSSFRSSLLSELSPPSLIPPISSTLSPDSLTHSPTSSKAHRDTTGVIEGPDPTAMPASNSIDHAVIGGVVAVIVFIVLCLLIVLGRYLIRHKGTYLTHEAKGSDDAPDADTAIINAEAGQSGAEDKKEYFI